MLGHLYAAEALACLDRINEALNHLEPNLITSLITASEKCQSDKDSNNSEASEDVDQSTTERGKNCLVNLF